MPPEHSSTAEAVLSELLTRKDLQATVEAMGQFTAEYRDRLKSGRGGRGNFRFLMKCTDQLELVLEYDFLLPFAIKVMRKKQDEDPDLNSDGGWSAYFSALSSAYESGVKLDGEKAASLKAFLLKLDSNLIPIEADGETLILRTLSVTPSMVAQVESDRAVLIKLIEKQARGSVETKDVLEGEILIDIDGEEVTSPQNRITTQPGYQLADDESDDLDQKEAIVASVRTYDLMCRHLEDSRDKDINSPLLYTKVREFLNDEVGLRYRIDKVRGRAPRLSADSVKNGKKLHFAEFCIAYCKQRILEEASNLSPEQITFFRLQNLLARARDADCVAGMDEDDRAQRV